MEQQAERLPSPHAKPNRQRPSSRRFLGVLQIHPLATDLHRFPLRHLPPSPRTSPPELIRELRNAAFACATINAAVCASFPPRLYVAVGAGLAPPKCPTRPLPRHQVKALAVRFKAEQVEEVTDHPILRLIAHPNSVHSGYDLLELTTLYLECRGLAYWYLNFDALDTPAALWPLPAHLVTPKRHPDSPRMVDYYEYSVGRQTMRFKPDEIVTFKYPDPRDPYTGGLSPLRAAFDHISLDGTFLAFKQAVWDNAGMPGAVISPKDAISPAERDRLEEDWNRKFRRGGQGKALIAEEGLDVKLLEQSLGDLATLAEQAATKEAIANAFGVPLSYLTATTNLANLEAADGQQVEDFEFRY